jgi:arylsulfatase A-like enzyme
MDRRECLKVLASAMTLALTRSVPAQPAEREKKIIFILIDDMGWTDLGCYGSGFYETPQVDRLRADGMKFTQAYAACPVCSPTRASIVTGSYPARLNLTDWIPGRQARGARPDEKLLGPSFNQQLPVEEVTIAELLKQAGYKTFFVGKWHLGDTGYLPTDQGYDLNVGGAHYGSPPGGYFSPYKNSQLQDGPQGECLTDRLTEEALRLIESNRDNAFLLSLCYYAVHNPMQAKPELVQKYTKKAENFKAAAGQHFLPEGSTMARQVQDHATYAAMVETVDTNIGRILDKLKELGLENDTAIIFMSDNGGLSTAEGSPTSNVPLRAGKGWLYEGGIREPMLIKWPGVTTPGSTCEVPVTSTDFYPTMLQMAGLPESSGGQRDGISLLPFLKGEKRSPDRPLYWHYPHYSNQGGRPGGAVRLGNYKLLEFYEDDHVELYDLTNDIGESRDLSKQMPEKAAEMRGLLHRWRSSVNARMPAPNPGY